MGVTDNSETTPEMWRKKYEKKRANKKERKWIRKLTQHLKGTYSALESLDITHSVLHKALYHYRITMVEAIDNSLGLLDRLGKGDTVSYERLAYCWNKSMMARKVIRGKLSISEYANKTLKL